MSVLLRSCLFAAFQIVITPPFAVISLLTFPFDPFTRYRVITTWTRLVLWGAETICGIRYRVLGAENVPAQACVVLSKHQSAWETLAFQVIFPPQVYVIKRELLWIPFFGWGLAMLSPVAIDRTAGMRALKQMLAQGKDRLTRGFWIIVFPEGTRVAPGARGTYQTGGAAIAVHAGAPVLPVAHNAGTCWGRHAFRKYPGTITVSIGKPIDSRGRKADALTREVETWIETEMPRLEHGRA
ncbi:MAG: 1-acyl-sn-glycerol-3-phosphate acyltransferase [Betaproteobacteria bacterium]|nr:1-acyl-sn-glycerol-3-phosphate acyltransferase [Betaproteobacteria bacterium]